MVILAALAPGGRVPFILICLIHHVLKAFEQFLFKKIDGGFV